MTYKPEASADDRPAASDRRTFLKSLPAVAPLGRPGGWAVPRSADSYPTGYEADHVDTTHALAQHVRRVTGSPSVHTTISYLATANGGAEVRMVEVWTDFRRRVQLVDAKGAFSTGQRYAADGLVYTKTAVSYADATSYDRADGDLLVGRTAGADVLERLFPHLDFELRDATTGNGERLYSFETTDLDTDSLTVYLRRAETVRSSTGSLTVDERGRIREFAFDLDARGDDGNPLTVEASLALDGFGRTTVRRPEWVRAEFRDD